MPPFTPTAESEQLSRIADELHTIALAHTQISVDFKRWVDSQLSTAAINDELLQTSLELQKKALEQLNKVTEEPSPALPGPESTAGGQVPGIGG